MQGIVLQGCVKAIYMYIPTVLVIVGGAVAPWLVHLTRG